MTRLAADPVPSDLEFKPLWRAREHLPVLASWLWREWGRDEGYELTETEDWLSEIGRADQRETGVVALGEAEPCGIALLCDEDLESRKDLSPWLSSLFVVPEFRGLGIASRLVREIERAAIERAVPILYLYTLHQRHYYPKLGWSLIETFQTAKGEAYLMHRKLLSEEGGGR